MTATAHALVAAAIASKVPDPLLASACALVSHFIMDCVPHWDMGTNWRKRSKALTGALAIGETLFGMILAYTLFWNKADPLTLSFAITAALLPDWLETPWYIFFASQTKQEPGKNAGVIEKMTYRIYKVENFLHAKLAYPWGLVTQIITVAFFLTILR